MTLLDALYQFLGVVCGMFAIFGGWLGIQYFVRRRSGCRNPNKDMLDYLLNGCGGGSCQSNGSCHTHTDSPFHEAHK